MKTKAKTLIENGVDPKEFAMDTPVVHALTKPYTREQLETAAKENGGNISAILEYGIWDISEAGLADIGFEPYAVVRGQLFIKVTGNVADWLEHGD